MLDYTTEPLHIDTPLLESPQLSEIIGRDVLLKMDALQPSGSFKIRGIGYFCQQALSRGSRSFVAASGGNAGLAVSYAAKKLKIPATVVVPESAPEVVRQALRRDGVKLIVAGKIWDDAHNVALEICEKQNATYVHPFDHPDLWTGHASLVQEIVAKKVKPSAVIVSVGGGGLLCGILAGLHRAGWEDVPVIAIETRGAACFYDSIQAGFLKPLETVTTIASTLGSKVVATKALEWNRRHPIWPLLVTDRQALSACRRFASDHRVIVEPACGAALAAVYEPGDTIRKISGSGPVVVVVCGGSGTSYELFDKWEREIQD